MKTQERTIEVIENEINLLKARLGKVKKLNLVSPEHLGKVTGAYHAAIGRLVSELNPNF